MSIFRIRDYLSVLLYRAFCGLFGGFGRRVRIVWPLRLVGVRHMHIGDDVTIANAAYIAVLPEFGVEPRLRVGGGTRIGEFAHIVCTHDVQFGNDVLVANRVFVTDCGHAFRDVTVPVVHQGLEMGGAVSIGAGSWIGENACILSAKIGNHCVVGANSVVTGDVPDHSVVAGAPARIIRRYCLERRAWIATHPDGRFRDDDPAPASLPVQASIQG